MANTVGSGKYTYELVERFGTLPSGWTFGSVSAVATDSQDRVYAFQRKDPPVVIFDRMGNYVGSWGQNAITDPLCLLKTPNAAKSLEFWDEPP